MHKLDKKDRAILYQLDLDSRQNFNSIGKKVRLSREVVQYRVKQLEKKGIIRGYQTLIDITKLGYITGRFMIKLQKDSPEDEEKIIEYYKKQPQCWWVDSIDGFRDFGVAYWVKNMYEFHEFKEDLVKQFGQFIHTLDIAVYHRFYLFKRAYLSGKKQNEVKQIELFFPEKVVHDEKDLSILRLIAANSRMSSIEIASQTKISVTNVHYRIKNMISNGIIKDFRVILDLTKIGYYWYKIEFQLEDLNIKKSMIEYFRLHPALNNRFYDLWMNQQLSIDQLAIFARNYGEFVKSFPDALASLFQTLENNDAKTEVASTLYSEMGYGIGKKAHWKLLDEFLSELSLYMNEPGRLDRDPTISLAQATKDLIDGQKRLYGSKDQAIAVGAQLALEHQAYYMLSQLFQGAEQYAHLWPNRVAFYRASEYFLVHLVAEKDHEEESIRAAQKYSSDIKSVETGFNQHLDLIACFWNGVYTAMVGKINTITSLNQKIKI